MGLGGMGCDEVCWGGMKRGGVCGGAGWGGVDLNVGR